jgi:hypothetical protein
MAVTPSNVLVAVTGAVSKGLTSATAPTGTASSISAFADVGGINEDGVTLSLPDNGDSTPIRIWQNGQTVRSLRTTSDDLPSISFVMVETSVATIETYFGVTVTQSATEGTFAYKVTQRAPASYVLDVVDGAELIRSYWPRGIVASVNEIKLANTDAIAYGVTIEGELDTVKDFNFKQWLTKLKTP